MSDDDLPGWYGKIASLGDFASRRLPAEFISNWDAWLQRMLPDSRARLGDRWLETYLGSPIWRFLLFPGICGDGLWAGLMMPSVDRVGRYFPLTIASRMPALASTERAFDALADWLDRLSTAALATLDIFKTDDVINANKTRAKLLGDATREAFGALPAVRHLRQRGMIIAFDVDTAERDFSQRFFAAGLDQGVLLRPIGNTVYFMPPYIVEADDIAHLVGGAAAALKHCIGG